MKDRNTGDLFSDERPPRRARAPRRPRGERPVMRARRADPQTSHDSMEAFDKDLATHAREVAVRLHVAAPRGLADFEYKPLFAKAWGRKCDDSLYRQARRAARDKGQIRDSGETRVSPITGRKQTVWIACTAGAPKVDHCPTCGHIIRRKEQR